MSHMQTKFPVLLGSTNEKAACDNGSSAVDIQYWIFGTEVNKSLISSPARLRCVWCAMAYQRQYSGSGV